MERALKKRLYVYTIGMFLATVVVVSVITIYYEYRVRYMATTLYGANKEAGKQLLYILFYGRQGNTVTADYSAILQEAGYTRNGAWYMFLYGGEYIPFAVIIGIMVILLAFAIYNIVKIGHNDLYSYMNKLKEDNENISKELDTYRTYMEKRNRQLQDFTENIAHQIKTPLTALSLSLDMIEEQLNARKTDVQLNSYISDAQSEVVSGKALTDTGLSSNEKLISNLGECFRQTYRIRDFITRLLKLSRMESGKIVLTEDDINVNEFINEVISEVPVVNNCNITSYCDDEDYFINADEYRRFHPNYKELYARYGSDSVQMTSGFSGAVTERLIHETSERGIHLIIEGTGRTTDVPHRTAELLVKKGYRVELAVIATRPEHSLCSTLLRFYEMNERGTIPRATAMEAHDYVVRVLPDNLDVLRDDPVISGITIWDRTPTKIYDSCGTAECPSEVLRQYWNRPWPDEELQDMQRSILRLRHKEEACQLKQSPSIDELGRRVQEAAIGPGLTFNTMM